MKNLFLILVGLISLEASANFDEMRFRERDGDNAQILYQVQCDRFRGEPLCTLKTVKVTNEKADFPCGVIVDYLFINAEAQNPSPGQWSVSKTAGLCNYTNTYVFSSSGMVQTKTSPKKIPAGMGNVCEKFPPKVYNIPKEEQQFAFAPTPIGRCKEMNVLIH